EDVVRRWGRLYPPSDKSRKVLPITKEWVAQKRKDARVVALARGQLRSIGRFMKCLKEPIARLANREDETRGVFFAARFKSVAILDEGSLLATAAYIDLAAEGTGRKPVEASPHTSIRRRVEHAKRQGRAGELRGGERGIKAGAGERAKFEESLWLCP